MFFRMCYSWEWHIFFPWTWVLGFFKYIMCITYTVIAAKVQKSIQKRDRLVFMPIIYLLAIQLQVEGDKKVKKVSPWVWVSLKSVLWYIRDNKNKELMDRAIFQFNCEKYSCEVIKHLTLSECEHLADVDENNVTKFNIDTAEELDEILNEDLLDIANCNFKSFI